MSAFPFVRPLTAPDLADAVALTHRVFCEYVAPEYGPEGVAKFELYIALDNLRTMLAEGALLLWGCFLQDAPPAGPVGVIALRPPNHLSLLFVDGAHHRQGIAKALFGAMLRYQA